MDELLLARKEVLLSSPYFVPDRFVMEDIREGRLWGVSICAVTPSRVRRTQNLGSFGQSIERFHAKAAAIDREIIFIGSLNFDPRSAKHNTELGMIIRNPDETLFEEPGSGFLERLWLSLVGPLVPRPCCNRRGLTSTNERRGIGGLRFRPSRAGLTQGKPGPAQGASLAPLMFRNHASAPASTRAAALDTRCRRPAGRLGQRSAGPVGRRGAAPPDHQRAERGRRAAKHRSAAPARASIRQPAGADPGAGGSGFALPAQLE